jgi:hypothetical protein
MIGKLTGALKQYTASYLQLGPHDACLLETIDDAICFKRGNISQNKLPYRAVLVSILCFELDSVPK